MSTGKRISRAVIGRRDGTIWYYEELANLFDEMGPALAAVEMRHTLDRLKVLVKDEK